MKDATELAVGISSAGFEFDGGRRRDLRCIAGIYRPLPNRETRGPCSGPLARKDFGTQLVVSLISKPL
jgi:hypothetical protein